MQFIGVQCDECKREERAENANGWLSLRTYVAAMKVADLKKPAPPEFFGTFCSVSCLGQYTEHRLDEVLAQAVEGPPETLQQYFERQQREAAGEDQPE